MKVNREEWLLVLQSVQAGLAPREIQEQSTCFVFNNGLVMTYNGEVMCSARSKLDKDFKGAVKATALLDTLTKYAEEELEIDKTESELVVKGKGKETEITMEQEILLMTEEVERPTKYQKLHEDFSDAIGIIKDSASNDASEQTLSCIHIHPKWIEATDRYQFVRYKLPTGISDKTLVRKEAIKAIIGMGMTEFCETKSWLHFKNKDLIISCRRFVEDYPPLSEFFKVEGTEASFPKGLQEAVDRAEIFSKENQDYNMLRVELKRNKLIIQGLGISGRHTERKKMAYDGKEFAFQISPKMLTETAKKSSKCVISEDKIKVEGGKWKYVTVLERVGANGHAAREESSDE